MPPSVGKTMPNVRLTTLQGHVQWVTDSVGSPLSLCNVIGKANVVQITRYPYKTDNEIVG